MHSYCYSNFNIYSNDHRVNLYFASCVTGSKENHSFNYNLKLLIIFYMCSSEARLVNCEDSIVVHRHNNCFSPLFGRNYWDFDTFTSFEIKIQRTDDSNEVKNEHGNKSRELVYISHRSITFSVNNGALYVVYIQHIVVCSIRKKNY